MYRYKRLMFGLNCAPEMFQRILQSILQGLKGVKNLLDNIIVNGRTQEEHDLRLKQVCKRLGEKGFTLNKEKCRISLKEVKFLGFKISGSGYRPLQ